MTYENTFQYIFAIILSLIGGYGFITGIADWQTWVIGSIGYLVVSKWLTWMFY